MKFEYQYFEGKFLPIIFLKIKGKENWVEFKAYVDSGASYCVFKADVAQVLGLQLEQGKKVEMTLGDADKITIFIHELLVSVGEKQIKAKIGFSYNLNINLFIIGRQDIFDNFIICFHERDKYIEFTPYD